MANDSHASHKDKDKHNSYNKKQINGKNGKGSISLGSPKMDAIGLRRSNRETFPKKLLSSSPSSIRRSDRLDKRSTITPLQQSEKSKKLQGSTFSGTKKSLRFSGLKSKEERKGGSNSVGSRKNRMDARTYRSWFKSQRTKANMADRTEELRKPDLSPNTDSMLLKNESVRKSRETSRDGSDSSSNHKDAECIPANNEVGGLQSPKVAVISCKENPLEGEIVGGVCEPITQNDNDTCNSTADGVLPLLSGRKRVDFVETCGTCSKRRRLNNDSPRLELCSCSAELDKIFCQSPHTDRGAHEAFMSPAADQCGNNVHQKPLPLDFQGTIDDNTCYVCSKGGKLLCCVGKECKKSFHLFCLDPLLDDVPPGDWYCPCCVNKKIVLGVRSVSEGIESIWEAREVEVSHKEGLHEQREKQYFVKYKGLAHIHNNWVPETQLILEAPQLLSKFTRKHQVTRWKQEWTEPHRLLQKRLLTSPKQFHGNDVQYDSANQSCHYEWLVKWCGLGYDDISWELENSSFLLSSKALRLMREFDNRRKNAIASDPSRTHKEKKVSLVESSILPQRGSSVNDSKYLCSINKIREWWHKGHNCVVFDDQDRIMKIVLFIVSLQPQNCQPFLIIANSTALSLWEAEFLRLAPLVNVVVYCGNKDVRGIIRRLEFFGDGGCVMFQVLLSSSEDIVEDLVSLKSIEWEVIIVDECQKSRMSTNLEQLKPLVTGMKLLIISGLIKDSAVEYVSLLSFLDPRGDMKLHNGTNAESSQNISELKATLSQYVVSKTVPAEFDEYWVPVQLSSFQLEQYCVTLVSNLMVLRSCLKNDPVGALHDILISSRKCCDHPYNVDPSLQVLLTEGLKEPEVLNIGIKASGKLQLLDALLSKIKVQGLRVLILFQTISGPVKDIVGDILEDFLRQRFGLESYERFDGGAKIPSQKERQTALDNFKNKDSGRFVFLLEYRACLSSIKLSSVDSIIIFDSGWNPVNDIRVLQKIKVYSQFERIKVFRLYSPWTVEEKVLALAKQGTTLDSNLQGVSTSTIHSLLMWGASCLFKRLDEIHESNGPSTSFNMSEQSQLNDCVQEILKVLCEGVDGQDISTFSVILKVQQSGGTYCGNISLWGELGGKLSVETNPHLFWGELLERRNFKWKYISGPSQRSRKRVQYVHDLPEYTNFGSQCGVKKRKKVDKGKLHAEEEEDNQGSLAVIKSQSLPTSTAFVNHQHNSNPSSTAPILANMSSKVAETHEGGCRGRDNLRNAQKNLHLRLRPALSKLCEVLQFPENARNTIENFLEYIMNNFKVTSEPLSILQAFQLALCWAAASSLRHEYDRDESLALARQHLNFSCKKAEADSIFLKLMDKFSCAVEFDFLNVSKSAVKKTAVGLSAEISQSTASEANKINTENEGGSSSQGYSNNECLPHEICTGKEITKKPCKGMKRLIQKQKEEIFELKKEFEKKNFRLENWKKVWVRFICTLYSTNVPMRTLKLKLLDKDSEKKLEANRRELDMMLKKLEAKHDAARNGTFPAIHMPGDLSEELSPDGAGGGVPRDYVLPVDKMVDSPANGTVESSGEIERNTVPTAIDFEGQRVNFPIGKASDMEVTQHGCTSFCNNQDNFACRSLVPEAMETQSIPQEGFEIAAGEVVVSNEQMERVSVPTEADREKQNETLAPNQALVNECSTLSMANRVQDEVQTGCREQRGSQVVENVSAHSALSLSNIVLDVVRTDREQSGFQEAEGILAHSLVNGCSAESMSKRLQDGVQRVCRQQNVSRDGAEDILAHPCVNNYSAHSMSTRVQDGVLTDCREQSGLPEVEDVFAHSPVSECSVQSMSNRGQDEVQTNYREQNGSREAEFLLAHSVDGSSSDQANSDAAASGPQVLPSMDVQHEELPNGCPLLSKSVEILEETASEGQNVSPNHSNHKASTEGPTIEEQLIQCKDLPSGQSYQIGIEGETSFQIDKTPAPLHVPQDGQGPMQLEANQNALTESSIVENQVLECTDLLSGQPYLSAEKAGENFCRDQRNTEVPPQPIEDPQDARVPVQSVENQAGPYNQTVAQFETHSAIHTSTSNCVGGFELHLPNTRALNSSMEFSNHPAQGMPLVGSRMPPRPLFLDPLQIQSERMDKEIEQNDKIHDDMAAQLESDCAKEIEEVRNRYEGKIRDIKAAQLQKRKELEKNRHKVQMNRILAEAFRSKCTNPRASGAPRMNHAAASTFMQQLVQQSTPRTNFPLGSSSLQPPPTLPVQSIHNPPPLLSSIPIRPALVGSATPFSGNFHTGSETRSPAPHVQPFRAPISPNSPSIARPQVVPLLTHHLPPLPPHLPGPPPPPPPPPPSLPLPPYQSGPRIVTDHDGLLGDVPAPHVTVSGPPLMNLGDLDSFDLPELGTPGTQPADRTGTGVDSEVVYLSDDD